MARSAATTQPVETPPAVSVYKVWYHFCPVLLVEARDKVDAANQYRAQFRLHYLREPKVELANGGN